MQSIPVHERRILEAFVRDIDLSELALAQEKLTEKQNSNLEKLIQERTKGYPLQYLTGTQGFYGRDFKVDPSVLIPRPETEGLVELCLEKLKSAKTGLELGTGSGCISITLAQEAGIEMFGSDCSVKALEVAKYNAHTLHATEKLTLFSVNEKPTLEDYNHLPELDFIVSNPPYLVENDEIADDVRSFEPKEALFSDDPFTYYEFLSKLMKLKLKSGGQGFFELADQRSRETKAIFENEGFKSEIIQDLTERDRYLIVWTN